MDQHQAAYWLSRDPAEAADFLARTAVASRAVGGFVKTAAGGEPGWLTPDMQRVLTHGAIGAGIGGAGGLGMGLFSKKKKNPLTTALTGATLGGVLGGAGPEVYEGIKGQLNKPPASVNTDQANLEAESIKKMSPFWQGVYGNLPWLKAPTDLSDIPVELQTPKQRLFAKPDMSNMEIGKRFVGGGIGDTLGFLKNFGLDNPVTVATQGLMGIGQVGGYKRYIGPQYRSSDFLAGVHLLDKPKPAEKGTTTTTTGTQLDPQGAVVVHPQTGAVQPEITVKTTPGKPSSDPDVIRAQRLAKFMEPGIEAAGFGTKWHAKARAGRQLDAIAGFTPDKRVIPTQRNPATAIPKQPVPDYMQTDWKNRYPSTAIVNEAIRRGRLQRIATNKAYRESLGPIRRAGHSVWKGVGPVAGVAIPQLAPLVWDPFQRWARGEK